MRPGWIIKRKPDVPITLMSKRKELVEEYYSSPYISYDSLSEKYNYNRNHIGRCVKRYFDSIGEKIPAKKHKRSEASLKKMMRGRRRTVEWKRKRARLYYQNKKEQKEKAKLRRWMNLMTMVYEGEKIYGVGVYAKVFNLSKKSLTDIIIRSRVPYIRFGKRGLYFIYEKDIIQKFYFPDFNTYVPTKYTRVISEEYGESKENKYKGMDNEGI